MISRRRLLLTAAAALPAGRAARGEALPAPTGPVVLDLRGAVALRNGPDGARFDLAMLQALPRATIRTATPWTAGPQSFAGALLRDLLAAVGAQGTTLRMAALNDYEVELPASDAARFPVVVADTRNGEPMPVRDRGPLWLIYPLDDFAELRQPLIHTRMIWQLRRIVVA